MLPPADLFPPGDGVLSESTIDTSAGFQCWYFKDPLLHTPPCPQIALQTPYSRDILDDGGPRVCPIRDTHIIHSLTPFIHKLEVRPRDFALSAPPNPRHPHQLTSFNHRWSVLANTPVVIVEHTSGSDVGTRQASRTVRSVEHEIEATRRWWR